MIKLTTKFFSDVRIRAIRAEFGATGVLTIIELMTEMFESPNGYWREWKQVNRMAFAGDHGLTLEELDSIIARMKDYGMVNSWWLQQDILTSKFFEAEFIKHCGAARYNRIETEQHRNSLSRDELMELGAVISEWDYEDRIQMGESLELGSSNYPKTYKKYKIVRVRSRQKKLAVFKRVKIQVSNNAKEVAQGNFYSDSA